MSESTLRPLNPSTLSHLLKSLRKKHKISLNLLSKLSGLSRRTLARLEARAASRAKPAEPSAKAGSSPRTIIRLLKLLLPPDTIDSVLKDATRLSRGYAAQCGGSPDNYRLLDLLPDFYPYFLFHPPRHTLDVFMREKYGRDYRTSLHQLVLRPPRNLGLRLRAFRLRHDLTLVQTAALLGLSKSQLHRIERGERRPSPPTAFKILRLLTIPSRHVGEGPSPSLSLSPSPVTSYQPALSPPRRVEGSPVTPDSADPLNSLRRLWLSGAYKTRDLAALLGISQPHLIRLLRGDRSPSKKLLERISRFASD